jgi:Family of unknown function (DUF6077)
MMTLYVIRGAYIVIHRLRPARRLQWFDALTAVLGVVVLCIVGPLRAFAEAHTQIAFVSTLALFMVPGILLSHWFLGEYFRGAALVPVAFVLSVSLFGVLAVPALVLHASFGIYLWVSGVIVFAFLGAATLRTFLTRVPEMSERKKSERNLLANLSVGVLWVPFAALSALLAYASSAGAPRFYGDMWVYLAWVREYLNADHLALVDPYLGNKVAALSRVKINGWLLEQAALSKVSGMDPVEMVMRYLAPTLVVVAMLAFYALALTLLKSKPAALFTGCFYTLFFLINLEPSQFTFGGEFVGRIAEDKFVAKFFFLPVTLCLAVAFLESRRRGYLWVFAFVCWSSVAVHPVGLAIIGLSMAGFGLVHVLLNLLRKEAWAGMVQVGAALLSFGVVPALFVLVTGKPFVALLKDADINSGDPAVLANMVFVVAKRNRILELGDGFYMMDPHLLHDPIILGALFLGLPFLLLRLKRALAAQLLAGTLILVTVVCYVPPIATFFGNNIVVPGQLWRLAWPLPLAAVLTVGWMGWKATLRARKALNRLRISPQLTAFLPLVLLGAMMAVATPSSAAAVEEVHDAGGPPYDVPTCFAPLFPWIRDNVDESSVVLAPDTQNTCIPAYSAKANVVSVRGSQVLNHLQALERHAGSKIKVPQRALDVQTFFQTATPQERWQILKNYKVDYVMAYQGSPTDKQLRHLAGLDAVEVSDKYFDLYKVEQNS